MSTTSLRWIPRRIYLAATMGLVVLMSLVIFVFRKAGDSPEVQLARIRGASDSPTQSLVVVRRLIQGARGNFPEAQLVECLLLLKLGKVEETKACFARLSHPEACDPEQLALFAEQALAVGENDLAAQALFATGEYAHQHPQRLKLLIFAIYSQQDSDERDRLILQFCEEYSRLVPDDPFPWLISSSLYHERGVPNLAVRAYRESLKRPLPADELHRVRTQLVQLELLLGELPQAREYCDALLKETRDPALLKMVSAMHAELLQREGKAEEALPILDQLLVQTPDWNQARALRGKCRFDSGDLPGAISDLSEAVRRNNFDQQSHYILAQAYRQQKNEAQANVHWNRSRELSDIMSQILVLENRLRNDLYNRELKLQLADLNEKRGDQEKADAWRRGAEKLPVFPSSIKQPGAPSIVP